MLPDADATAQARNSNTDLDGRASVAALPDTGHLGVEGRHAARRTQAERRRQIRRLQQRIVRPQALDQTQVNHLSILGQGCYQNADADAAAQVVSSVTLRYQQHFLRKLLTERAGYADLRDEVACEPAASIRQFRCGAVLDIPVD
jgi:hypothetical protein